MTKKFKLSVPVFTDSKITVVFTDNYAGYIKRALPEHFDKVKVNEEAGGYYVNNAGKEFIVFDTTCFKQEETIVHECFHATADMLMYKNIFLTEETEETYAYLLEFLFGKVKTYWLKVKEKIHGEVGNTSSSDIRQVLRDVPGATTTKS